MRMYYWHLYIEIPILFFGIFFVFDHYYFTCCISTRRL